VIVADAEVEVHADVRPFNREARAAILGGLRGFRPTVAVELDTASVNRQIAALERQFTGRSIRIGVDVDSGGLAGVQGQAGALGRDTTTVRVDADTDGALAKLRNLRTVLNGLSDLGRLGSVLLPLGALTRAVGAGFGVLAGQAGIGGLVTIIPTAVAAVSSLSGALLALPAAAAVGGALFATLSVGLLGFGDALNNIGDPEKLAEALEGMAPAAQSVILAIRDLQPAFQALKLDVQTALFEELGGMVTDLGGRAMPTLRNGLVRVASTLGDAAAQLILFAGEAETLDAIDRSFGAANQTVRDFAERALPGVLTALRSVVQAGLPFINQLGAALTTGLAGLTEGVTTLGVTAVINDAIGTARALGAVLADVGGILSGVFQAAAGAGNPLGGLGVALDQLNAFVNSPAGQGALGTIFSAFVQAATALGPVIAGVLTALGPLLSIFANLATAAAPFVATLLGALAPALASLAPAASILGASFGTLIASLAPVLPVVAQLVGVLAGALGGALRALAPAVAPVVTAIAGILSAVAPLVPFVAQLAAVILTGLAGALTAVAPALTVLVQSLVVGLAPVLPVIAGLFAQLAPVLGQVAAALVGALAPAIPVLAAGLQQLLVALQPVIPLLGEALTAAIAQIAPLIPLVVQNFVTLGGALITLLPPLLQLAAAVLPIFISNAAAAAPIVTGLVNAVAALAGPVAAVIGFLARLIGGVSQVGPAFAQARALVTGNMTALRAVVSAGVTAAVGFLRGLPGRAVGALASLGGLLTGVGTAAMGALGRAITSGISTAVAGLRGLAGRAVSAVGNLGSTLVGAGGDLLSGLARGITNAAGRAISAAREAASRVKNAVTGFFRISSPSRVFMDIGRDLMRGQALGITRSTSEAVRAAVEASRRVKLASVPTVATRSTPGQVVDRARVTAAAFDAYRRAGFTARADRFTGANERLYAPSKTVMVNMPGPVSRDLTERDVLDVLRIVDTLVPET
jgi:phage-related protein